MTDNPQAFPGVEHGAFDSVFHSGMTLRDYFAGQVIAGHCSSLDIMTAAQKSAEKIGQTTVQELAESAYDIADAMLEARKGENHDR